MPKEIEQMQGSSVLEKDKGVIPRRETWILEKKDPSNEALSKVDAFIQQLPEETGFLLAEVRRNEDFRYAANVARKFIGQDAQTVEELKSRVAGYLFETFTYLYLSKQLAAKNKVLLSPHETLEVYCQRYPTRKKVSDKYGLQNGIEGISVPDGIVLTPLKHRDTVRVDGVCEYMLGTNYKLNGGWQLTRSPATYNKQLFYLTNQRNPESIGVANYIHSRYPHLPINISVHSNLDVFVSLPQGVEIPSTSLNVRKISVPVSTIIFGNFVNAFMSDIKERKDLYFIFGDELGISQRTSSSDPAIVPEDIGDIDGSKEKAIEELKSIETPEFGSLSKADVALIAERLEFNRDRLEPFFGERGVRLIEESALSELIDLVEGQEIELQEAYREGRISAEEFSQLISDYRARAFEKAQDIIKDPDIDSILEKIGDKNPNVWVLLVNLSEVNDVIEKSGHEEGISLLAQNPEVLKTVLENPENEDGAIEDDLEAAVTDGSTTVFEAQSPVVGIEPVEPKPRGIEARDPNIRVSMNQFLDKILEIPELNGPVSPAVVTRFFERIKKETMERAKKEGWVSAIPGKGNRAHVRYDASRIATLLYLCKNENLPSRLKKRVEEIAQEEFDKRKEQQTIRLGLLRRLQS